MQSNNKIKLFCFPYAGGGSHIFYKWKAKIGNHVELIPVELTGRGKRFNEPLYKNVYEAVEDICAQIAPYLDSNFAFFGHSLGAMLSYEVARKLKQENSVEPLHLFFSGRGAPNIQRKNRKEYHKLNDFDFKGKIKSMGGTPKEFFNNEELLNLYLPVLRNDFKLASEYIQDRDSIKFDCPINVFVGKDEEIESNEIDAWKYHTNNNCSVEYFNGGHFFINEEYEEMISIMNRVLEKKSFSAATFC